MTRTALFTAAGAALALSACSDASSASDGKGLVDVTSPEFGEAVRAYLVENPEVIEEALIALQEQRNDAYRDQVHERVALFSEQLLDDPRDPRIGPNDAAVTIVEFFDYNCSACHAAAGWVQDVVARYPDDVQVIFKESPIFADQVESSSSGPRIALAAAEAGVYEQVHFGLMDLPTQFPTELAREVGRAAGLSDAAIDAALANDAYGAVMTDSLALFSLLGLRGTPAFFVNGEFVDGFNPPALEAAIAQALGDTPNENASPSP